MLRVEADHQVLGVVVGQARGQRGARAEHRLASLRSRVGVDRALQAETVDVLLQFHQAQNLGDLAVKIFRAPSPGGPVIDPFGLRVERRIGGAKALGNPCGMARRRGALAGGRVERPVLQAVDQVFAHREREQIGVLADVGQAPAGHRLRQLGQVAAADLDAAGGRRHQPGQHHAQVFLTAAAGADDRHMVVDLGGETDRVHENVLGVVEESQRGDHDLAGQRRSGVVRRILNRRVDDLARLELVDHLLVLDLYVEAALVPVDELLDGPRQVLVGGDHRDQGADVEVTVKREQSAAGIEGEGRQLGEKVVEKLDEELAPEDLVTDLEDPAQARGHIGALEIRGVVRVHLDRALDHLADPPGERARLKHALPVQAQDRLAELRNEKGLA